jgi:hypothetical protein
MPEPVNTHSFERTAMTSPAHPSIAITASGTRFGRNVADPDAPAVTLMELQDVSVFYGDYEAVRGTTLPVRQHQITAMIGPSGCGKSTILRSLNRMNDLIPGAQPQVRQHFARPILDQEIVSRSVAGAARLQLLIDGSAHQGIGEPRRGVCLRGILAVPRHGSRAKRHVESERFAGRRLRLLCANDRSPGKEPQDMNA